MLSIEFKLRELEKLTGYKFKIEDFPSINEIDNIIHAIYKSRVRMNKNVWWMGLNIWSIKTLVKMETRN